MNLRHSHWDGEERVKCSRLSKDFKKNNFIKDPMFRTQVIMRCPGKACGEFVQKAERRVTRGSK